MTKFYTFALLFTLLTVKAMSGTPLSDTLQLPLADNFDSGTFTTNGWIAQSGEWHIDSLDGIQVPCAEFQTTEPITDYNISLESAWIDGNSVTDCRIKVDFSHKLVAVNQTGNEKLFLEVFSNGSWHPVFEMSTSNSNEDFRQRKINITQFSRGKIFKIRFRASGLNSNDIESWLIDNIKIYKLCEPPYDLITSIPDPTHYPCRVLLEWTAPCNNGLNDQWKHYDNGNNFTNVGLTTGGSWRAAIRLSASQFSSFDNAMLEKIKFFVSDAGSSFSLMVWKGNASPELVYTQPVDTYSPMSWNEFNLDSIIPITPGMDFWVGYEVAQFESTFPAGTDNGPAVSGFGDMVWTEQDGWKSLSIDFYMNYNWNIQAWITDNPDDTCSVVSYHVYANDGVLIGNTEETSFLHVMRGGNEYICYQVSALYNDGESTLSYERCEYTEGCPNATEDVYNQQIQLFPNPAGEVITLNLIPGILSGTIIDFSGREIEKLAINPTTQTLIIDLGRYKPGVYFLKLYNTDSIIGKKFLVL